MMKLLIVLSISLCMSKVIKIECPKNCKCDLIQNYKRISCINRTLVDIDALIPKESQILDLSYNRISRLTSHIFFELHLTELRLFNVSHNKLSQIHMNAFEGLDKLKSLDLSHNALQYLLKNWFRSLPQLKELYLNGNRLGSFTGEPAIQSSTLRILDLSSCGISSFNEASFSLVPNLELLDVSNNYLIQLNANVIKPLMKLRQLKATNNYSCNGIIEYLSKYCIENNIKFKNPCLQTKKKSHQFEKIQLYEEPEDEKNFWLINDELEDRNNSLIISNCSQPSIKKETLLLEIIHLSPVLSILIPFIYGISIGLLIACTVQKNPLRKKELLNDQQTTESSLVRMRRRSRLRNSRSTSMFSKREDPEFGENLVLSEWNISESTPMSPRKILNYDVESPNQIA